MKHPEVKTAGLSTGAKLKVLASGSSRPYLEAQKNKKPLETQTSTAFSEHPSWISLSKGYFCRLSTFIFLCIELNLACKVDLPTQRVRVFSMHFGTLPIFPMLSFSSIFHLKTCLFPGAKASSQSERRHHAETPRNWPGAVTWFCQTLRQLHTIAHASRISSRCENDFTPEISIWRSISQPDVFHLNIILGLNSNLPAGGSGSGSPTSKPYGILQLRNFGISFTGNFSGSTCKCSQSLSTGFTGNGEGWASQMYQKKPTGKCWLIGVPRMTDLWSLMNAETGETRPDTLTVTFLWHHIPDQWLVERSGLCGISQCLNPSGRSFCKSKDMNDINDMKECWRNLGIDATQTIPPEFLSFLRLGWKVWRAMASSHKWFSLSTSWS